MADKYGPIDEPSLLAQGKDFSSAKSIRFIHPGYTDTGSDPDFDILIALDAFDDNATGLHYTTAHTACAIIANNEWDGYFALDRHGTKRVDPPADGILRADEYYFCLPGTEPSMYRYPVIASFDDWRFPHRNLPAEWQSLKVQLARMRTQVRVRGMPCAVSNCGDAVEVAHLVPSAQQNWWRMNLMKQYAVSTLYSTRDIDSPVNSLLLRCDIHKVFDERHMTFVPKATVPKPGDLGQVVSKKGKEPERDSASQDPPRIHEGSSSELPIRPIHNQDSEQLHIVGHIFSNTPSGDLPRLWHNRPLYHNPPAVSVEFLFARFAWTIFSPYVFKYFLDSNKERTILVWDEKKLGHRVEEAGVEQCQAILKASRARSQSPKKRPHVSGSKDDGGWEGESDGWDSNGLMDSADEKSDLDSGYHDDSQHDGDDGSRRSYSSEPERGRRRKRLCEELAEMDDTLYRLKRNKVDG